MRYVRYLEDPHDGLEATFFYCRRLCFEAQLQPNIAALQGGWRPGLDDELGWPEPCRICGDPLGPVASGRIQVVYNEEHG